MTVHDKIDNIAQKMILEVRVTCPSMMFELPMFQQWCITILYRGGGGGGAKQQLRNYRGGGGKQGLIQDSTETASGGHMLYTGLSVQWLMYMPSFRGGRNPMVPPSHFIYRISSYKRQPQINVNLK